MKTIDNKLYLADEGKIFIRKSDGFIMGTGLDLGIDDSIDNYEEQDTPEDYTENNIEEEVVYE